jgi:hypothetical protein
LLVEVPGLAEPLAPPIAVAVALPFAIVVTKVAMVRPSRTRSAPARRVAPGMAFRAARGPVNAGASSPTTMSA